jgi:hypothetical protein
MVQYRAGHVVHSSGNGGGLIADAAALLDKKEKNPEKTTLAIESDAILKGVVLKQLADSHL